MQYVKCTVVIHNGKFKLEKEAISVPEIVVLRAIHGGDDAVTNIRPAYWKRVQSFAGEKKRLLELYGQKEAQAKLVDSLFPGAFPRLPTSLRDIATGNKALDGEDGPDAGTYDTNNARAPAAPRASGPHPALAALAAEAQEGGASGPLPMEGAAAEGSDDVVTIHGDDDDDGQPATADEGPEDYSFLNQDAAAVAAANQPPAASKVRPSARLAGAATEA